MALVTIQSASIAVTPWKPYPANVAKLAALLLPRITPAITEKIQAAESNHTRNAPIHHNMITSRSQIYSRWMDESVSSPNDVHAPAN